MSDDRPHYVYRCYDADGDLIYIGCTSNVTRRIATHRRGGKAASRWLAVCMDRYEVSGPHAGKAAGLKAEAEAIALEQPVFNYQKRVGENLAAWMTRAPIAQYLTERGHVELAQEIAA
jgi:predicted GIY-YIG superfamily endonuclease